MEKQCNAFCSGRFSEVAVDSEQFVAAADHMKSAFQVAQLFQVVAARWYRPRHWFHHHQI